MGLLQIGHVLRCATEAFQLAPGIDPECVHPACGIYIPYRRKILTKALYRSVRGRFDLRANKCALRNGLETLTFDYSAKNHYTQNIWQYLMDFLMPASIVVVRKIVLKIPPLLSTVKESKRSRSVDKVKTRLTTKKEEEGE
jgi:hypothetical protein